MKSNVRTWRALVARVLVLTVALAAVPLPALAGESSVTASSPGQTLRASIDKAVATQTLATARPAAQQSGTTTDLGSKSFFKTPGGMIALVALAVGVGYAIYSTNNDRVKSPAR